MVVDSLVGRLFVRPRIFVQVMGVGIPLWYDRTSYFSQWALFTNKRVFGVGRAGCPRKAHGLEETPFGRICQGIDSWPRTYSGAQGSFEVKLGRPKSGIPSRSTGICLGLFGCFLADSLPVLQWHYLCHVGPKRFWFRAQVSQRFLECEEDVVLAWWSLGCREEHPG